MRSLASRGVSANVGCKEDLVHLEQGMIFPGGFNAQNIQSGSGDLALCQSDGEGVLIPTQVRGPC